MTAAADALVAAERYVYAQDEPYKAEVYDRRSRVQALSKVGMSSNQIAVLVGISDRQVERIKKMEPPPVWPKLPDPQQISDERCAELEQLVEVAIDLACRLRDENPVLVSETLSRMGRRELQEFAVVLLAAMRVDCTVEELFGWVLELDS